MAVAFDAVSTAITTADATSLSWSHTCTGSNRILMVGLSFRLTTTTDVAVTYGGVAMTLVNAETGGSNGSVAYMFRLVAPASGSNTIAVTWTTSTSCVGGGTSFTGVSQSVPLGTSAKANGSSTTATVNVSSASDEIVVDVVAFAVGGGAPTVGADQTQRYAGVSTGSATNQRGAGSTETGAATTTMSWTFSSANWGIVAVPVKPLKMPGTATISGVATGSIQANRYRVFSTSTTKTRFNTKAIND